MSWLARSENNEEEDESKFEVDINGQAVDALPFNATESYLVQIPQSVLEAAQ